MAFDERSASDRLTPIEALKAPKKMKPLPIQTLVSTFLIVFSNGCCAQQPAASSPELRSQVVKMTEALGWPEMIRIALQRGDLQRAAKAKVSSEEAASCVNEKYTEQRVLTEIVSGYEQVYTNPLIVSKITAFVSEPGAKRIFAAVAARAPAVGASAAYEERKSLAWQSLTAEERSRFDVFATSDAGQAYLSMRPTQMRVHQERLATLTRNIVRECAALPVR